MTQSPRFVPAARPVKIQEALRNIGGWLLDTVKAEPGWNELALDIKPLSNAVFVRIVERRGDQEFVGSVGPLKQDSSVILDIENLQHATYDEEEGTWFTATVVIAATQWPDPQYQIGASYNRQEEPQDWEGEGRLTARELRDHFEEFPRAQEQIPDWARTRLGGRRGPEPDADEQEYEVPNQYLTTALEEITPGVREDLGVVNVLRASLGGDLLLDISNSTLIADGDQPIGPQSTIRYKVLRLRNGMRALCAFSSSQYAYQAYRAENGDQDDPTLLREIALKVYMDFMSDESCELVVIDPGTPQETFIEKPQVSWVLSTPHNDGAKRALMAGNMQQLLASLVAPSAFLLMGVRPGTDTPLFVPSQDDKSEPDTMLVFTSAAEIASVDPGLEVRSAPALDVLKFANQLGAVSVRINASNPSATLPIQQIRELIAIVEASQQNG